MSDFSIAIDIASYLRYPKLGVVREQILKAGQTAATVRVPVPKVPVDEDGDVSPAYDNVWTSDDIGGVEAIAQAASV